MSLTVPAEAQKADSKICWHLADETSQALVSDAIVSWTVDDIGILPIVPSLVENVLQFRLQMNCKPAADNTSIAEDVAPLNVIVQYSRDQGRQWTLLHQLCLPPACSASYSAIQSSWSSDETTPWERITLPLPYAALSQPVRFRFLQKGRDVRGVGRSWAVDDVHISACLHGCHGHGTCTGQNRCRCDDGYAGDYCDSTATQLASSLNEDFESAPNVARSLIKHSGMTVSSACGIVAMGSSAIFEG